MNQADFDGTEVSLLLMRVAYNFPSLFKQLIIGGDVRNRLKTLRYKMPAIPSIIERSENKVIVCMAIQMNRQNWIRKLCERIQKNYPEYS
jgi:hypothetical protein